MESTSIDTPSIRTRAVASLEFEQVSPVRRVQTRRLQSVQSALQQALFQSQATNGNRQEAQDCANLRSTGLPSTVVESIDPHAFVETSDVPQAPSRQPQKMTSETTDATQELSNTQYQYLISRSRSVVIPARDDTQHTLNEGDEGHVDITSSYVQQEQESCDDVQAVYSPARSPRHLSQFPESQRFKTPATAGKKRSHDGNTRESPGLPRAPMLRSGGRTPAHVMGLSQAFNATQADTSPYIGPVVNERSDRPSPNIDLEFRPTTAAVSSPLLPLSEVKRTVVGPASRYVSTAQSQADRDKHEDFGEGSEEESDDGFADEPSYIKRMRIRRERERRLKDQFRTLSSPNKGRIHRDPVTRSSPIIAPQRSSLSPVPETRPRPIRRSSATQVGPPAVGDEESEAETEQEDESRCKSAPLGPTVAMDEEDKENRSVEVRIPETRVRLQRAVSMPFQDPDTSPSVRNPILRNTRSSQKREAGNVAVENSQPSQPPPRNTGSRAPKSSSTSGLDYVPQSQLENTNRLASSNNNAAVHTNNGDIEVRLETREEGGHFLSRQALSQFTSPPQLGYVEYAGEPRSNDAANLAANATENGHSTEDVTDFETAPTRPPPASSVPSNLAESSPPIVTTPPGRKRKRMSEIAAQPSPQQSTQGFDPVQALGIDKDVVDYMDQSPIKHNTRAKRRKLQTPTTVEIAETHTSTSHSQLARTTDSGTDVAIPKQSEPSERQVSAEDSGIVQVPAQQRGASPPEGQGRTSLWELDDTPSQKRLRVKTAMTQPAQPVTDLVKRRSGGRRSRHKSQDVPYLASSDAVMRPNDVEDPNPNSTNEAQQRDDQSTIPAPAPNNLLAHCYDGKRRGYFPARCLTVLDGEPLRYRIQWDGFDPDEVHGYSVRALDLRVGDHIKVNLESFPKIAYVIRGFGPVAKDPKAIVSIHGHTNLLIAPKQRKSMPADVSAEKVDDVPISDIYLDSNMWQQMKDRPFEFQAEARTIAPSGYATPVERPSTPSTPSSRTRRLTTALPPPMLNTSGLFANMVFAISYEDATRKEFLTEIIQRNGGTTIRENFDEMFDVDTMELKPPYAKAGFTALLADHHSRKVKYMQALALGLPCLSGKWVEACFKAQQVVDWQKYLLAAGESDALEKATRSRIIPPIDPTDASLSDILNPALRFLHGTRVVVIVGKGKSEEKRRPFGFLIAALGAQVTKVQDVKAACSFVANGGFDWVFVEDRDVESTTSILSAKSRKKPVCKVGGNEMIVQSLILGELCE